MNKKENKIIKKKKAEGGSPFCFIPTVSSERELEGAESGHQPQFSNFLFVLFFLISLIPIYTFAETPSLYHEAAQYYQHKQFDSAFIAFNKMVNEYPQNKLSYYNRGLCLYQLKKYSEALQDFNTSLKIDSNFKEAKYMKCHSLEQTTDLNQPLATVSGSKDLEKRIKYYRFSVLISKNWYYMLTIMLLMIILITIIAKSLAYKKG